MLVEDQVNCCIVNGHVPPLSNCLTQRSMSHDYMKRGDDNHADRLGSGLVSVGEVAGKDDI